MKRVSKAERVTSLGIDAIISIYNSLHESSTVGHKVGGTICLDHCAVVGLTRSNNYFKWINVSLVTGHKLKNEQVDKPIGFFI